jgi:hypothetical protein
MSSPLHTATVGVFLQILPQVVRLIDKAEAHCRENGLPDEALTGASLTPDMWPFAKQISYVVLSSAGAMAALRTGVTGPDLDPPMTEFAPLRQSVTDAIAVLQAVQPGEIDDAAGRDVVFAFSTNRMEYVAEDFLLSFCLPNFFFHATTAYAVLRSKGVNIGKRDFLGKVRLKR